MKEIADCAQCTRAAARFLSQFWHLLRHQHRHRDARHAGQLAGVVAQLDGPDLGAAADVHRARDAADTLGMGKCGKCLRS